MNNVLVYCELTESNHIADISLELCTKGRHLATEMNGHLQAVVAGSNIQGVAAELYPYGVDEVFLADDPRLSPYRTLPHFAMVLKVIQEQQPNVVLFGATTVGRDLAPRVASRLRCGLTADCTSLELGDHTDAKTGKEYKCTLHQIRPAFGGNIIATIVSPEVEPHMATVREGVMRKEIVDANHKGQLINIDAAKYLRAEDDCLKVISRQIDPQGVDIKGASIIVAGGYGMGSRENFDMLYKFANMIGGEVGASRAAIDAGFCDNDRQIGQTGVTVRPKLYIACGISGAVQHRVGMEQSGQIISINTDPDAPINSIADYTIIGDVCEIIPRLMNAYQSCKK
jgi:electron transfer flavoprotein alpha subunit